MTTQNSLNNQTVNANFTVNRTDSGSQAIDAVVHSQNTAGSDAKHRMQVAGTSAGDPFVEMAVGATRSWCIGPISTAPDQPLVIGTATAGSVTPLTASQAITCTPFTSGIGGIAVLRPQQPRVLAVKTAATANATGNGTIATVICDTELYDVAGEYNNATGVFTAAFGGTYLFNVSISLENLSALHTAGNMDMFIGGNRWYFDSSNYGAQRITAGGNYTASGSFINSMAAGTTMTLETSVSGSTQTVGISGLPFAGTQQITWISIYYIG